MSDQGPATEAAAVEVLACTGCGAPIALGDGSSTVCPYCGVSNEIPEAHRTLREAEREAESQRVHASRLIEEIGRPPGPHLRALSWTWNVGCFVLVFPFAPIAGYFIGAKALGLAARVRGEHLFDVLLPSLGGVDEATTLATFIGAAFPLTLWILVAAWGGRKAVALRDLQAGLSARRPLRRGGAAECRSCGAPLEVREHALAARCLYCKADNLVAIPRDWVAKARKVERQLALAIDAAVEQHEAALADMRKKLVWQLVALGVITGLVVLFMAALMSGDDRELGEEKDPYAWHEHAEVPALLLDRRFGRDLLGGASLEKAPELSSRGCTDPLRRDRFRIGREECTEVGCIAHWYVALRRGDSIELTGTDVPPKTLSAFYAHDRDRPFDQSNWGLRLGRPEWIGSGRVTRFEAPHSGWFMVWLAILEGGEAHAPYRVCAQLRRR